MLNKTLQYNVTFNMMNQKLHLHYDYENENINMFMHAGKNW